MAERAPRVVILDRDGVLNDLVFDPVDRRMESPSHVGDVRLAQGAVDGCRWLLDHGCTLAVASNQPAAAKGKATIAELEMVHRRIVADLAAAGVHFDLWRYCCHHPEAVDPALRESCACRKPGPGLLLQIAGDLRAPASCCWMVGDADTDIEAGIAAGCRTALVENPSSAHRRTGRPPADLRAGDLLDAARQIVGSVG